MTHCVNKGKRLLALFLALLMVCSIIAQMPIEADAAAVADHLEKYINTYGEKTDDGMQLLESFYQSESLIITSLETRKDDEEERIFRFGMLITTEESKRVDIYAGFDFEVYGYPSEIVVEHAVLFYNNDKMYNSAYVEKTINYKSHTNSSKYSVTSNCSLVSNSQFSGTFNSSLGMLLTYWDGYLYEELGFGLQALGFSSYESEFASDTSGRCGENVYWNFKSGTLNVFGTGDMYEYDVDYKYPWDAIKDDIERVVIEEGVTSIGYLAFGECSNLKTAVIAGSVAEMVCAFSECSALTSVTLKEGLTEISAFAFEDCTSLESVTIPDSVTIIDFGAFAACTNLKNVTFGKNVTYIGTDCFFGCTALSNVVLPANLTYLGARAFEECGDLGEIIIPSGITMFEYDVFNGSNVNYNIYNGAKYLGDGTNPYFVLMEAASKDVVSCDVHADTKIIADAFYQCQNLKTVTIPDGIRVVSGFAFYECANLETAVFPDSVQYMGHMVFADCPNLKNVTLGENTISIGYIDEPNIEYNRYNNGAYLGSGTNPYYALISVDDGVKNFVAHKDTKVICGSALESEDLQTVDFGESLISFSLEAIGYSPVKTVTIPKTVKYIGKFAFDACENLKNVYYEGTKSQWNEIQIEERNDLLLKAKIHYAKLPKLTAPSVTVSDGELSWGSVANASYYEVYRSTSKSGTYKKIATVEETTFTDAGVAGTTYYYKVKAVCAEDTSLNSNFSAIVSIVTKCAAPVLTVKAGSTGKPVLTWNKVTGAKKYEIWRSVDGAAFKKLTTTTKTTYTDSKATAGSECTYKVKALGSSSTYNGDFGNTDSAVVICAAPSITVKLDSKTGKPSISWKKVTGAKSYAIYRSVNGGEYQQLTTTTAVSYKDQTAEADNKYSYYVVTLGKAEEFNSVASAAKSVTLAVKAPKLSGSANAIGNSVISWSAVENAVSYKIYRSTKSNKSYTLLDTTAELSYTDSTVATGSTYYYKVVAVGANTESAQSSYLKQVGKCATPTIQVVLDEDSGKPMISWEKIEGAKKYTVYRATSETGKYSKLGTTTKLTYTDSKASVGTKYFYKIVANPSSSSANSNYSNIENGLTICAKAVITAKIDAATGKPTLSWKKVTGAKTYEIYRSENGGEYILVATQTAVTYKDTTAVAGNTYSYQVKVIASKTGADSLLSAEKTVIASCAQPKIKGKVGATGKPELTWGEVEGATKYIIYRSTSKTKGYTVLTEREAPTYTDTTAVKGKTYYYKVVAICDETESAQSAYCKVKSK